MINCISCEQPAEQDGYCNKHYWHTRWLDNRKNGTGIVLFSKMILPVWARDTTPEYQEEVFHEFFSLYSSKHVDKYDRLLGEIGFRGAAKTTQSKIILCYLCCFGLEKFIVYCSETNTFAVQDTFEVRRELSTNPHIRKYFGVINSKAVKGQDGEWSKDAYLTATGVYVLARGVGQQVRSALRNSYRPTLAVVNDMYSKDKVKTEYTRNEFKKWFFQDLFNAVDDIDGKVFFNGTILHEDTVPVILEHNKDWKILKYPIMELDDFQRVLKECKITDDTVEIPSDEKINELEKTCKLYWPQRLPLRYILRKFRESHQSKQVAGFYQEYFHIVTPPEEKPFKNINRVRVIFFKAKSYNWLKVDFGDGNYVTFQVQTYAGVDPASATTQASAFTAIPYIAVNKHRQIFVLGYSRGKFALRDEFQPGYIKPTDSDISESDRSKIKRIGMVDEEIRLCKQYSFTAVNVETVQQQQSVYDEIVRIMSKNKAWHRVHGTKPTGEMSKVERDADILAPYFQTNSIFLVYGLYELELEMETFPRGATVDIIDGLAYAVQIAREPEGLEFSEVSKRQWQEEELIDEFMAL